MPRETRSLPPAINGVIAGRRRWAMELGECVDMLARLPESSVDALVTDPPFVAITHYHSTSTKQRAWADMSLLGHGWSAICEAIKRILKPSGHAAVFCNASSYPVFYGAMYDRWEKLACLVWDKTAPGLGSHWRRQHELIIVARDPGAWTPSDGRLRPDVLRHKITPGKRRVHPIHKPPSLLAEVIEAVCPPDGIVLDPFAGSGSTGEAALSTGRRFIGLELNAGYAKTAADLVRKSARRSPRQTSPANPTDPSCDQAMNRSSRKADPSHKPKRRGTRPQVVVGGE